LVRPVKPAFLLDVNVGRTVKQFLDAQGYDVKWITEIDARMPDEEIIDLALREGRLILTVDKDFGELIFNKGRSSHGVIRLEDAPPSTQIQYMEELLIKHLDELEKHFIVAQNGRVRIRPLVR